LAALSHASPASSTLRVAPNGLSITESFHGAAVTFSADIPTGTGAVMEIKGPTHDDHLLRKGRRGGLWMSVGEVTVLGAPSVYLVLSTPELTSGSDGALYVGYGVLRKQVRFTGAIPKDGVGALFAQFVKLKESESLYGVFPKSLKSVSAAGDMQTVEGRLAFPSNIAPGTYRVELSVFRNGAVLEKKSADLRIDMAGLPGLLGSLAYRHATLYGLIAVLIALVTGFVMGVLFKGKGAH